MNDSPKKIRALVVDDEPLARRGICRLLQTAPDIKIVGEAGNGQDAIAAVETQKPDLVFLDIQMPLLDGFSVIEKIDSQNLPEIVFVTAFDEHAIRAFEINALDYLLKPIDLERFEKCLERVRERLKIPRTKNSMKSFLRCCNVLSAPDRKRKKIFLSASSSKMPGAFSLSARMK
jgi:two-component system LytT family response regulator